MSTSTICIMISLIAYISIPVYTQTSDQKEVHVEDLQTTKIPINEEKLEEQGGKSKDKINATLLSTLYETVMSNYKRKFRPNFGGNVLKVELELHILSFSNIDEGAMEYGMDFYFAQFWIDHRFKIYNDPRATMNIIGPEVENLWLPDTVFINSKSSKFHHVTVNNRFLSVNFSDGRIIYHSRISTKASCRMDLRDYPFDQQTCLLAIESYGYDQSDLRYGWFDPTGKNCTHIECRRIFVYDKEMSNFDVVEAIKSKNKSMYHAQTFSSATAQFMFKRRTQYFILQVYLPCILIVMVTWTSFWITPTAVPARSAICVTTILTLITMLGIVNVNMPKVSYIKALDLYLFVSFIFVFLSLLEYIIVLNFAHYYDSGKRMKRSCQFGDEHPGNVKSIYERKEKNNNNGNTHNVARQNGILQYNNCSNYNNSRSRRKYSEKRKTTYEETVIKMENDGQGLQEVFDDLYQNKGESNQKPKEPVAYPSTSSSTTDMIARFLFPIAYACFNVGYWTSYLSQKKEIQHFI